MTEQHSRRIAAEMGLGVHQIEAVRFLLSEGGTVPFIARYRKERTGSLDEVAIATIRDRFVELAELDKRREVILKSLGERELLTKELKAAIEAAETLMALEDIYLPYRPKRRTRATLAREKGLEPLAQIIFAQGEATDPAAEASAFVDPEKGVESTDDALAGARDIIAEWASESPDARSRMREIFWRYGTIRSRVAKDKETEGIKYRDYFEWEEPVAKVPSHRVLAMLRGENEGCLKLTVAPTEKMALNTLQSIFLKNQSAAAQEVAKALKDSYKRLLGPAIETETRNQMKQRADDEAIKVFARNLRETLMEAPLGQKAILAIDPGYRTGCKVVCLDQQGKLLDSTTIYPTRSEEMAEQAKKTILDLVQRHKIEAIAIGNGTAGRETESFVCRIGLPRSIPVVMVNESGASIYSASEAAREEFPEEDLTVRGAVSIGRRLMDPLAELVKIDPKSIGVGQYQHDVDQTKLRASLDDTVTSCVNAVGVEVNTASKQLLTYVSGLGPSLAQNIVAYRNEHGPFRNRDELRRVPRLGPKAFEQAAGFLRINDSANPLDRSAVHPESYAIVNQMAQDLGCTISDLIASEDLRLKIDLNRYTTDTVGIPTLTDIIEELAKPGRDPRREFESFSFAEGIHTMDDLVPGMKVPGIVTNVTNFGAFVDIGVHHDGLVHISQLADRFVRDPAEIIKVHQKVMVTVLDVDKARNRIALSMLPNPIIVSHGGGTNE